VVHSDGGDCGAERSWKNVCSKYGQLEFLADSVPCKV
jgi:hypothetical protein